MADNEKISVLVPVYNEEKYLNQCIESVVNQKYQNWELILIDDGSTDTSLTIAQKWVDQDPRIKLFQEKHGGLNAARNAGIQRASGEYLFFLDSDDFLVDSCLETLYSNLKKYHSDIAATNYYELKNGYFYFHLLNKDFFAKPYTVKDWFSLMNNVNNGYDIVWMCFWGKLFKRSLFKNFIVPENKVLDDGYSTWKLYLMADSIVYCNMNGYCYRRLDDSMSVGIKKFEVDDIEEKYSVLATIGFPLDKIKESYLYEMNNIKNKALACGNYAAYQQVRYKLDIINKYSKVENN